MESARIRAVVTAIEEGSISAAAEKLGYTPSGISQLISALESELGFQIIVRSRKGVRPTGTGKQILPAFRDFLDREDAICQIAGEIKGLEIGSVTVGTYPSISAHWLPDVIVAFQERYPAIEIHLMEGIRQEICGWLDDRIVDLAFFSYREPMKYDWFPLAEDRMLAVLPSNHPLAGKKCYPVMRCQEEEFIMPALGHDIDVEHLLENFDLKPNIRFSTLENFSTIAMIEKGLGMSIMNELCTLSWESGAVMLPLDPPQTITFGIAVNSYREAPPAVRKFLDFAVERLTKGRF